MKPILFQSATEITKLIRDKKISCEAVAIEFLNHIKAFNTTINAISDIKAYDDIICEARVKDMLLQDGVILGPLHGLPITVKDSFNVEGLISSNGNPKLKSNIVNTDAELVKRLKKAGNR